MVRSNRRLLSTSALVIEIALIVVAVVQGICFWLFFLADPVWIGALGGILVGTLLLFICVLLAIPLLALGVSLVIIRGPRRVTSWVIFGLLLSEFIVIGIEYVHW